jgi:CRISPR type III-B/RAMP module-associated protein Cmr5
MSLTNSLLVKQKFAFDKIQSIPEQKKARYKSFIESFGLMVYNNGLINALTFAKAKQADHDVYEHISAWLQNPHFLWSFSNTDENDLIANVLEVDSQRLLVLTQEVISFSDILKAFAKAEL